MCSGIHFRQVLSGMGGAAWSKDALSDNRDDSRLLMPAGMFLVVIGGWLLSRWTYCSEVFRLCKWLISVSVKVECDV